MKTYKKILAALFCMILSCALFAACGDTPSAGGNAEYTVTYNSDGGTLTGETSVKVKAGESVTLPTVIKNDCTFEGWYNGSVLAGIAGEKFTPAANVTLTAHWTENPDYAAINYERAVEYAKVIRELYWDSNTKLSKLTPTGGVPFLWPNTEQPAMVNGILLVMPKNDPDREFFETYLEELMDGLRYYRAKSVNVGNGQYMENDDYYIANYGETDGTANAYAIYNSGRGVSYDSQNVSMSSVYFDDNIWVAKEFYYAYLNLGDEKYLNEAVNIVNWIVGEGYESHLKLNGIYWQWGAKFMFEGSTSLNDSSHASLNACSSAPTAMMLAKLYQVLSDSEHSDKFGALAESYLSTSMNIYEFCYATLMNTTNGCLRDKIFLKEGFKDMTKTDDCIQQYDEQILPYNTGTYMSAGAELYGIATAQGKTAVAKVYNNRNTAVAQAADIQFANPQVVQGQYAYNKNSWFTSFLIDGYIDIEATGVDCSEYAEHLRSSLDYGWNNNRAADKLVSPAWVAGWSEYPSDDPGSENNGRQILLQAANAHCYAMLAHYYE